MESVDCKTSSDSHLYYSHRRHGLLHIMTQTLAKAEVLFKHDLTICVIICESQ